MNINKCSNNNNLILNNNHRKDIELSPKLIRSYLFNGDKSKLNDSYFEKRNVKCYELEFILHSIGGMYINDIYYETHENDIIFRRPGDTTKGSSSYGCYAIFFHINSSFEPVKNPLIDRLPVIWNTSNKDRFLPLFVETMKENLSPSITSEFYYTINIFKILTMIYNECTTEIKIKTINSTGYDKYIKLALKFIDENWHKKINIDEISTYSGLSRSHFIKVFTKSMDVTPNDYIVNLKIEKAKEFLAMSDFTITEIALNCGFDNIPYFSYVFRKKAGLSPLEFRRNHTYPL